MPRKREGYENTVKVTFKVSRGKLKEFEDILKETERASLSEGVVEAITFFIDHYRIRSMGVVYAEHSSTDDPDGE